MKKFIVFSVLTLFVYTGFAQTVRSTFRTNQRSIKIEELSDRETIFLFDDFEKAIVFFSDTTFAEFVINYRLLRDEFIDDYEDKISALARSKPIDSLVVKDMVFIYDPAYGYLERIGNIGSHFYIKHSSTFEMREIKQGAYGEGSVTAAIENVNLLSMNVDPANPTGAAILENLTGQEVQVSVTRKPALFYNENDDFFRLETRRALNRRFPQKRSELRAFMRTENIDLDNRDDLMKLANFLGDI